MGKPESALEHVWCVLIQLGEKRKIGRARTVSPTVSLIFNVHLAVSPTFNFQRQTIDRTTNHMMSLLLGGYLPTAGLLKHFIITQELPLPLRRLAEMASKGPV